MTEHDLKMLRQLGIVETVDSDAVTAQVANWAENGDIPVEVRPVEGEKEEYVGGPGGVQTPTYKKPKKYPTP